jgi:hypothetical protein
VTRGEWWYADGWYSGSMGGAGIAGGADRGGTEERSISWEAMYRGIGVVWRKGFAPVRIPRARRRDPHGSVRGVIIAEGAPPVSRRIVGMWGTERRWDYGIVGTWGSEISLCAAEW